MIVLPSIAFGGFSGSAKDVTARQVHGRSILSVRCWPTGESTNAQVARRASLGKISKSWKLLTNDQMRDWDRLAEHASGQSVFGQKAQISGMNLYIRLNANRAMAGEDLIVDAPANIEAMPGASFDKAIVTPEMVILTGVGHEAAPMKLVVKMSGCQSPGVSNGWSKTVIISSDLEDDWGEADVTKLYLKTIGVEPAVGQKVFIEMYWMDTETGFTGEVQKGSVVVITQEEAYEQGYQPRKRIDMDNIDLERSQVQEFDMDFSTGAPLLNHSGVLEGTEGLASSVIYPDNKIEGVNLAVSFCIGRGTTDSGKLLSGTFLCYLNNHRDYADITYTHRGGDYHRVSEIFGSCIMYEL